MLGKVSKSADSFDPVRLYEKKSFLTQVFNLTGLKRLRTPNSKCACATAKRFGMSKETYYRMGRIIHPKGSGCTTVLPRVFFKQKLIISCATETYSWKYQSVFFFHVLCKPTLHSTILNTKKGKQNYFNLNTTCIKISKRTMHYFR